MGQIPSSRSQSLKRVDRYRVTNHHKKWLRSAHRKVQGMSEESPVVRVAVDYDDGSRTEYVIREQDGGLPLAILLSLAQYQMSVKVMKERGEVVVD